MWRQQLQLSAPKLMQTWQGPHKQSETCDDSIAVQTFESKTAREYLQTFHTASIL
jgi:hypothetical protein